MIPLFFSQTTNFEAIENLVLELSSQVDDCTAHVLLNKIDLFALEFLYKQERATVSPAEWHAVRKCYLAFEGFKCGLEAHSMPDLLLKTSRAVLTRFNLAIQPKDDFQSFFRAEREQLVSLATTLAPCAIEEPSDENQELLDTYCQKLNALYGPFDLDASIDIDKATIAIWGLEDYLESDSVSEIDKRVAMFHLLSLKLHKHHQYVYDLQDIYRQFEELLEESASLDPYIQLKLADIISIHLKFDSDELEHFTNKQRKIWLSLSLPTSSNTDPLVKLRSNYLLAKSYQQTKCLPLRNWFMAKKKWEEILKNTPPDSPYVAEAHLQLSFLHIFGVGKKFEINLSKGLAHLTSALESSCLNQNLIAQAQNLKTICSGLHSDETFCLEIPRAEKLNSKETFGDALFTSHTHLESHAAVFRKFLSQMHSPGAAQFLAEQAGNFHACQYKEGAKEVWYKFWMDYISELFSKVVKSTTETYKHLDEASESCSEEDSKSRSLHEILAVYGPEMLSEALIDLFASSENYFEFDNGSEVKNIPVVNIFNECITELQKIAQGIFCYSIQVSAQANQVLYYMRSIFCDHFESKDTKVYQSAFINNINASKIALLNARRFSLCPISNLDAICECYSTINFLRTLESRENQSYYNCVLAWMGEKYNLEKSLNKDTYDTFANAICIYYIAVKATPERKLEILKDFQKNFMLTNAKQFCLEVCKNLNYSSSHPQNIQAQFNPIIVEFLGHFIEFLKYEGLENIQEIYALVRTTISKFMLYQFLGLSTEVRSNPVKLELFKHKRREQEALLKDIEPDMPPCLLFEPVISRPKQKGARSRKGTLPSITPEVSPQPSISCAKEPQNITQESSTQESKKLALRIEQERKRKLQLKSRRTPAGSKAEASQQTERKAKILSTEATLPKPSICLSAKALAIHEKIFTPQNPALDVAKCTSFDANDFRTDRTDIKREDVALLIEELGGKYIKSQGKGSHTKCTLTALEENADVIVLSGQQMAFANFEPFERPVNTKSQAAKESQMILTKSPYLKSYQIRQLCKKLIALGFTPEVVKRKA